MRDLVRYPVTALEVAQHLEYLVHQSLKGGGVGGTEALLATIARDFIGDNREAFEAYVLTWNKQPAGAKIG